jgi:putative transposase
VSDWQHSSFHRYVERGLLTKDWGGDMKEMAGSFGE